MPAEEDQLEKQGIQRHCGGLEWMHVKFTDGETCLRGSLRRPGEKECPRRAVLNKSGTEHRTEPGAVFLEVVEDWRLLTRYRDYKT